MDKIKFININLLEEAGRESFESKSCFYIIFLSYFLVPNIIFTL